MGTIEKVNFFSAPFSYPYSPFKIRRAEKLGVELPPNIESAVPLFGYLLEPAAMASRSAVVLLHTCAGLSDHDTVWAERLVDWGHTVLVVDSLAPRDQTYLCDGRPGSVTPFLRALDAYGARRFLVEERGVPQHRGAGMGLSHGGISVMEAIKQYMREGMDSPPFAAGVAYYPLCSTPTPIDTPTLVLVGAADSWTPASLCQDFERQLAQPDLFFLEVYADAHHVFDHHDIDVVELGYTLRTHPEARQAAEKAVRQFLDTRLN